MTAKGFIAGQMLRRTKRAFKDPNWDLSPFSPYAGMLDRPGRVPPCKVSCALCGTPVAE
jgi:hypothetical protein